MIHKDGLGYIAAPELPGQPLLGHGSLFRDSKQYNRITKEHIITESLHVRVATSALYNLVPKVVQIHSFQEIQAVKLHEYNI